MRKRVHAQQRKSHARVAECGRDHETGEAEPGREVEHQELHQRPQRQVADDQQASCGHHHRQVALERNPEQSLQNERRRQHDDEENQEQRRELAGERDDRVATRAGEPGAHAAPAELGADGVAGGERDDHMGDHRQQRAQQKLRVVPLRIDQHDRLGNERPDAGRFWGRVCHGCRAGGGEAVAQTCRRHARGRQELLIVECDHLRPALGLQVALEIGRDVDCGNGVPRPDRARRRREVVGALDDAKTGRRSHLLDEGARGLRSVRVDDDHPEIADHWLTEDRGQDREGEHRHAEDQDERHAVAQQPSPFASGDQQEAWLRRRPHRRARWSI